MAAAAVLIDSASAQLGQIDMQYHLKMVAPAVSDVPATTDPVTTSFGSGLFMEPGVVEYNVGHRFNVTDQGLLSIMAFSPSAYGYTPYVDAGFRIVKNASDLDVYAVIAALGALIQYGLEDEGLTVSQKLTAMKSRKLRMRCGHSTEVVRAALSSLGVVTRNVHLLTADTPSNMDDGHVAFEAFIDGQWRFFDLPGDSYFTDSEGEHLNIGGLIDLGLANSVHVRQARTEASAGTEAAMSRLLTAVWEQRLASDELYLSWAARIFQIPGILWTDGNIYYYLPEGTESRQSWVLGLQSNYRVISKADWLARFY